MINNNCNFNGVNIKSNACCCGKKPKKYYIAWWFVVFILLATAIATTLFLNFTADDNTGRICNCVIAGVAMICAPILCVYLLYACHQKEETNANDCLRAAYLEKIGKNPNDRNGENFTQN